MRQCSSHISDVETLFLSFPLALFHHVTVRAENYYGMENRLMSSLLSATEQSQMTVKVTMTISDQKHKSDLCGKKSHFKAKLGSLNAWMWLYHFTSFMIYHTVLWLWLHPSTLFMCSCLHSSSNRMTYIVTPSFLAINILSVQYQNISVYSWYSYILPTKLLLLFPFHNCCSWTHCDSSFSFRITAWWDFSTHIYDVSI